jgi:hypothetical protein
LTTLRRPVVTPFWLAAARAALDKLGVTGHTSQSFTRVQRVY